MAARKPSSPWRLTSRAHRAGPEDPQMEPNEPHEPRVVEGRADEAYSNLLPAKPSEMTLEEIASHLW